MQQLSGGRAPHFEQVVWHRCDDSAVCAVPGHHGHHQFGFVISIGNSTPEEEKKKNIKAVYGHKKNDCETVTLLPRQPGSHV